MGARLNSEPRTEHGRRIVTGCKNRDDFIALIARLSDGDTIFLVTHHLRPPGTVERFSLRLADGSPALGGMAEVVSAFEQGEGPGGRTGITIRFSDVDGDSRPTLDAILAAATERVKVRRATRPPLPRMVTAPLPLPRGPTRDAVPRSSARPAAPPPRPPRPLLPSPIHVVPVGSPAVEVEGLPPVPPEAADGFMSDSPTQVDVAAPAGFVSGEERTPGSDFILPANPFGDIDDDALRLFVDTSLLEEVSGAGGETARIDLRASEPGPRVAPWRLLTAVGLAMGMGGLAAGYVLFSPAAIESNALAAGGAVEVASRAERVQAAPSPPPAVPPAAPIVAPAEPPTDAQPGAAAEAGVCRLAVEQESSEARVFVDGAFVGTGAYRGELPCGERMLRVEHPRYEVLEETIQLAVGEELVVRPRLERPVHVLTISSIPSGATVLLGGKAVGKTPTSVRVPGFQRMKLGVTRPGYIPVSRALYLKKPKERMTLQLIPDIYGKKKSLKRSNSKPARRRPAGR